MEDHDSVFVHVCWIESHSAWFTISLIVTLCLQWHSEASLAYPVLSHMHI